MSALEPAVELFLSHVAVEKGLARNSVEAYGRDLRRYAAHLEALGISRWDAVGRGEIQAHLAELVRRGLSPRSQARALSAIRSLHALLAAERLAAANPTDEIDGPRAGRRLPALLSRDEIAALLAAPTPGPPPGGAIAPCWSCSTRPGCASPSSSRSS